MIGSIRGKIIIRAEKFLIVEINGIGYKISVSSDTLSKLKKIKEEVFFNIYTHVRENALELYGFLYPAELEFFEMLIDVPGIGPKGALGILSMASIETLKKSISLGDTAYLTKISGIGKKTAEKVIVELRDKLEKELGTDGPHVNLQEELDTLEALKSLGYSQYEAREALKKIPSKTADTHAKIKEALKILAEK